MTASKPKSVLERNFLFRELPGAVIDKVAALATQRSYAKDEVVFLQHDRGDALYGVCSGKVRISASASDGNEVFFNIMEPGDTFGEIALIDGKTRTASAITMEPAQLLVIQRTDFLDLLTREPELAIHLLELFCSRLRSISELVEDSALLSVPERLAKRLLGLAREHGQDTQKGAELKISQSELAQFLSISRQIVNQYLQEWKKTGCVELSRGKIIIRDADALRATAEGTNRE